MSLQSHGCSSSNAERNPSMYALTNRKQRDYKRKFRHRDYRLPNPGGIKGLRLTDEVYMCACIHTSISVHIYLYQNISTQLAHINICIYIYIYMCVYV